ncbi:MAG TPA: hypothetical protein VD905_06260 [Flavobacteriales bacterium]|nr:hypothetical protein [Flavobacteriales bacterium]
MQPHLKYTPTMCKEILRLYARFHNWNEIESDQKTITFKRGNCILNIIVPELTALTTLDHKKRGRKTLERHGLDYDIIKEIFKNPRVHTGKGVY